MKYLAAFLIVVGMFAGSFVLPVRNEVEKNVVYRTERVEKASIAKQITATGRLKALVTVDVSAQIPGQVTGLFVDFNQSVASGQKLARIDQRSFRARVNEARAAADAAESRVRIEAARVAEAKSTLKSEQARRVIVGTQADRARTSLASAASDLSRLEALRKKGSVAEQVYEAQRTQRDIAALDLRQAEGEASIHEQTIARADASLRRAEAEMQHARSGHLQALATLELTEIELARTEILSPIDGIVIDRTVEVGQTVTPSVEAEPMFRIARNLTEMEVHARVDEADIGAVRVGQSAEFQVDALPGRRFAAAVGQIRPSPQIVNGVVTYTVVLTAENPDLSLLPGMTALVRIVVEATEDDALTVPNAALRFQPDDPELASLTGSGQGNAVVWTYQGDAPPRPLRIETGISDVMRTQVLRGEITNQQLVVVGVEPTDEPRRLFGLRIGF